MPRMFVKHCTTTMLDTTKKNAMKLLKVSYDLIFFKNWLQPKINEKET